MRIEGRLAKGGGRWSRTSSSGDFALHQSRGISTMFRRSDRMQLSASSDRPPLVTVNGELATKEPTRHGSLSGGLFTTRRAREATPQMTQRKTYRGHGSHRDLCSSPSTPPAKAAGTSAALLWQPPRDLTVTTTAGMPQQYTATNGPFSVNAELPVRWTDSRNTRPHLTAALGLSRAQIVTTRRRCIKAACGQTQNRFARHIEMKNSLCAPMVIQRR